MLDYNFMLKNGTTISKDIVSKSLKESEQFLQETLSKLRPMGNTALGPGLLTAVAIAGEGKPGSNVILCTDGMATNGLGAFSSYT